MHYLILVLSIWIFLANSSIAQNSALNNYFVGYSQKDISPCVRRYLNKKDAHSFALAEPNETYYELDDIIFKGIIFRKLHFIKKNDVLEYLHYESTIKGALRYYALKVKKHRKKVINIEIWQGTQAILPADVESLIFQTAVPETY